VCAPQGISQQSGPVCTFTWATNEGTSNVPDNQAVCGTYVQPQDGPACGTPPSASIPGCGIGDNGGCPVNAGCDLPDIGCLVTY